MSLHLSNKKELICDANAFSWSFSRYRLFKFCKRAYFYMYYAANAGWDENAPDDIRYLYKLKKRKAVDFLPEQIFGCALRNVFINRQKGIHNEKNTLNFLEKEIFRLYSKEKREYIYYFDGETTLHNEIFDNIRFSLFTAAKHFASHSLFEKIKNVNYTEWKNIKLPVQFFIADTPVWISPHLIWTRYNICNILRVNFSNSSYPCLYNEKSARDDLPFQAKLNITMAKSLFKNKFEKIQYIDYDIFGDSYTISEDKDIRNIESVYEKVLSSAEDMLRYISSDGKVYEKNFPLKAECCNKNSHALHNECEFKYYCMRPCSET